MEYLSKEDIKLKKRREEIIKCIVITAVIGVTVVFPIHKLHDIAKRGEGNKYNCEVCRKQGFSCKEHIGYSIADKIDEKIDTYGIGYKPNLTTDESKELMYRYKYNTECDFCKQGSEECYSCMYDRETIRGIMNTLVSDEVFKSKLNNSDWSVGYPESFEGRQLLIQETKSIIHGENKKN